MEYYLSAAQHPELMKSPYLVVRAATAVSLPPVYADGVSESVATVVLMPFLRLMERETRPWRIASRVVGAQAVVALLLAAVGVYAVASYSVQQRRSELGIRLCLGAPPVRLALAVMKDLATTLGAGLLLGSIGVVAAGPLINGFLFKTSTMDLTPHTLAAVLVVAMGLAGAIGPARWAMSIDVRRILDSE